MKPEDRHLTYNQMKVLEAIAQHAGAPANSRHHAPGGRRKARKGVYLFYTDLPLATIRSLFKRGFVDTRRGGRVVVTWKGKRRLKMPWPKKPDATGAAETSAAAAAGGATAGTNPPES